MEPRDRVLSALVALKMLPPPYAYPKVREDRIKVMAYWLEEGVVDVSHAQAAEEWLLACRLGRKRLIEEVE